MPNVRGCNLAENRLYDVDNHIWLQELGDGRVKIGMTAVATAMAGQLVAFTPKKVGKSVKPARLKRVVPCDAFSRARTRNCSRIGLWKWASGFSNTCLSSY